MRVIETKVMRGPNYWSVKYPKLVIITLEAEETFSKSEHHSISKKLKELIPTVKFSDKLNGLGNEDLYQCHLVESVVKALQNEIGVETEFTDVERLSSDHSFNVIFSYKYEKAAKQIAKTAVTLVNAMLLNKSFDPTDDLRKIQRFAANEQFGPSTGSIVEEAIKRDIPVIRLDDDSFVQFGYGKNQKRIQTTIASTTSNIAVDLAGDKEATKRILDAAEIPVPKGVIIYEEDELQEAIDEIKFPLVVKPVDGNHGKGATTNINSFEEAVEAFRNAKVYSKRIICERFIPGRDFRVLVVNYKFEAAAMRTPAAVIGNGRSTIEQLIDEVNKDPKRGTGHDNLLTKISIDDSMLQLLHKKGYDLQTVPEDGEEVWLKSTANLSTGGTATDVTDSVHPKNIALFERIAKIIGLDICGIDVMATDLSTPIKENNGAILEVNAAPGFRMHLQPTVGTPRNVAKAVVDMLFPNNSKGRIPIISITGTNGKTTTTRLIAHIGKTVGHTVGYTSTDGVYIQDELIVKGDCSGPGSAEIILKDPSVDLAVLECARGGMLRSGLAFSKCDVAVVTNVAEDHLGLNGIHTIEQLAKVKSILPKTVMPEGFAVLNADDDLVYAMREELNCNIALFSMNDKSARIRRHVMGGGIAAVCEHNFVTILHGNKKMRINNVADIPITFQGKAEFNIANCLAAALAGYVQKVRIEDIRKAFETFVPGADITPGRMNIFDFKDFTIMLDYAHNPHGMRAIGKFIKLVDASRKVGVIAGVGDRRDEDLIALGHEAAQVFDEIIIRLDKDLRGRSANELTSLVSKGVKMFDPLKMIRLFEAEKEAVEFVLTNATPGSFIVVLSDTVTESLEQIKAAKLARDQNLQLSYVHSLSA